MPKILGVDRQVTSNIIQDETITGADTQDGSLGKQELTPALQQALLPAGVVLPFAGTTVPTGFLLCDGIALSRTTFSELFAAIGTSHGSGDGSTTFCIPDYRYTFLRGAGTLGNISGSGTAASNNATFTGHGLNRTGLRVRVAAGTLSGLTTNTDYFVVVVDQNTIGFATSITNALAGTKIAISGANSAVLVQWQDPDAATRVAANVGGASGSAVGSVQADQFKSHTHTLNNSGESGTTGGNFAGASSGSPTSTSATGGNETRPLNAYVNYIIKL